MDRSQLLIRSDLICARPFTFCEMLVLLTDCQQQFIPVKNGLPENCNSIVEAWGPGKCAVLVVMVNSLSLGLLHISTVLASTIWLTFSPFPRQQKTTVLISGLSSPVVPNITGHHCHFFSKRYSRVQPTSFMFQPISPIYVCLISDNAEEKVWDEKHTTQKIR